MGIFYTFLAPMYWFNVSAVSAQIPPYVAVCWLWCDRPKRWRFCPRGWTLQQQTFEGATFPSNDGRMFSVLLDLPIFFLKNAISVQYLEIQQTGLVSWVFMIGYLGATYQRGESSWNHLGQLFTPWYPQWERNPLSKTKTKEPAVFFPLILWKRWLRNFL